MKKLLLGLLIAAPACANPPQQVAPGYQAASAVNAGEENAISPPKEYQTASPAAEHEGLFLADQPTEMKSADGLGVYKLTNQGYQYYAYKGEGAAQQAVPTAWFGNSGTGGTWGVTQGTYDSSAKNYSFAANPTLVMQKNPAATSTDPNAPASATVATNTTPTYIGSWQQYNQTTKTFTPLMSKDSQYTQSVGYIPGATNPYTMTLQPQDPNLSTLAIKYNSVYPTDTPMIYNNGTQVTWPKGQANPFVFNQIPENSPVTTQYLNTVYSKANAYNPADLNSQIQNFQHGSGE